jgi:hypothetical protein
MATLGFNPTYNGGLRQIATSAFQNSPLETFPSAKIPTPLEWRH